MPARCGAVPDQASAVVAGEHGVVEPLVVALEPTGS
jgi:hypothetical protein